MDIYDNIKLASYVAAAEAFNKSQNVFYGFLSMIEPLLLTSPDKLTISFLGFQKIINETYGVSIQKNTLRYLLQILEDQGKVKFIRGNKIVPTKSKIQDELEKREAIKSEIEDLFLSFQNYLSDNGYVVPASEIRDKVCTWIYWHSCDLAKLINFNVLSSQLSKMIEQDDWEYSDALLRFLIKSKESHTSPYTAFLRLYDGAIQASLLNFSPKEIQDVANADQSFKNIIIDTNFALRLLELQEPLDNEVSIATYNTLKSGDTEFWILRQTIQEAKQSIKNFIIETAPYTSYTREYLSNSKIHTTGFTSALMYGVTRERLLEYSKGTKFEDDLIEKFHVHIVEDYDPEISSDLVDELISSKNSDTYGPLQAKHDLILINYCHKQRLKRIKSFSDVSWWVLTNDKKLTHWNEKNGDDYPECIAEVQLSNLLWLYSRKDNSNGLTNTIVALAAKSAISFGEISIFAKKIDKYREEKGNSIDVMDTLALVFASSSITSEDVKRVNADDDGFAILIEEKINKLKLEDEKRQSEIRSLFDTKEEELSAAKKSIEMKDHKFRTFVEVSKLVTDKTVAERDIEDVQKEIASLVIEQKQMKSIDNYCKSSLKSIRRIVAWGLAIIFSVLGFLILKHNYSTIRDILKENERLLNVVLTILGSEWPILFTIGMYYLISITIFGELVTPPEIFEILCEKILEKKKGNFILKNGYNTNFLNANIEHRLSVMQKEEQDAKKKLQELQQRLDTIKSKLAQLTFENE